MKQLVDGVVVHESAFLESNAVVVAGRSGVLLVDPGLKRAEIAEIATHVRESGEVVAAGFSTHPHWDHVLWDAALGSPPRYGTDRCAAEMRQFLASEDWRDRLATVLPPEITLDDLSLDLLGRITGLPAGTERIPWDGPEVRVVEHRAHTAGHAALLIHDAGVLVAGDMLSDILIPMLDLKAAAPLDDYLAALQVLEDATDGVDVVIPGHGSVGDRNDLRARIEQDRAYVEAVREGRPARDPRLEPAAPNGSWLPGVDQWQRAQLAGRRNVGAKRG